MTDALSAVLRAGSFVFLLQAAGIALFDAIFGRQLACSRTWIRATGQRVALAGLVLVGAHYALEAARMAGELSGMFDTSMQAIVWGTSVRAAWIARTVGLALIAIGLGSTRLTSVALSLVGAALATIAFTLTGHTTVSTYRGELAALLEIHLLIVAFWLGALAPLYVISGREAPARAAAIIERFSAVATWLVPGILVAGTAMAFLLIPSLSVFAEPYGELLLVKVTGFALLMGLAAANKWRLGPAIAGGSRQAVRRFRRSIGAEGVLIVVVLAATAVMTAFFSAEP